MTPEPTAAAEEKSLVAFGQLPAWKQERARAIARVAQDFKRFFGASGSSIRRAAKEYCPAYNTGAIEIDEKTRRYVPHVSRSWLLKQLRRAQEGTPAAFADGYGNRAGRGRFDTDEELRQVIVGALSKQPAIRPARMWEFLEAKGLADRTSERRVRVYMARWKAENHALWLRATNPDAYKSKLQAAFGSADATIDRLNELWELDSTPADVMLADGRHSILGVIDVYSRRLKLLVSKTSKATAVATLFRRALLAWGVPEAARTDNGQDYASIHLTTVLRALRVEQIFCIPFASEQKPYIERHFRTFSHGLLELRPGFIGHNVAERQAIRARKSFAERLMDRGDVVEVSTTSRELQAFCDQWTDAVYAHRPHAGLNGKTPWQVASEWTEPVNRITNERALDLLLMEMAPRMVGKKGIRIDNALYIAGELAAHIGEQVEIDAGSGRGRAGSGGIRGASAARGRAAGADF